MKVQLGAFDQSVAGWVNTDISRHLFIARVPLLHHLLYAVGVLPWERYVQHREGIFRKLRYVDLTRPLPFNDGSVQAFFSSHVLEHLYFAEVEALIREMQRCLVTGGICRVVVPDLDKLIALYESNDPRPFIDKLFEASSRKQAKAAHHSAFTGSSLVGMFTAAGFSTAATRTFQQGQCPDIELLDNRPDESLYVEAVK